MSLNSNKIRRICPTLLSFANGTNTFTHTKVQSVHIYPKTQSQQLSSLINTQYMYVWNKSAALSANFPRTSVRAALPIHAKK